MENVGDVDRRFGLLRVDAVLDSVHVLLVVDVENLAQFQPVRIVVPVPCAEGVLVVQHKGSEVSCHLPWVEPFHLETLQRESVS